MEVLRVSEIRTTFSTVSWCLLPNLNHGQDTRANRTRHTILVPFRDPQKGNRKLRLTAVSHRAAPRSKQAPYHGSPEGNAPLSQSLVIRVSVCVSRVSHLARVSRLPPVSFYSRVARVSRLPPASFYRYSRLLSIALVYEK